MSTLRVGSFTISLDGLGAGPYQDLDNPLGVGGTSLHGWALPRTREGHGVKAMSLAADEDRCAGQELRRRHAEHLPERGREMSRTREPSLECGTSDRRSGDGHGDGVAHPRP